HRGRQGLGRQLLQQGRQGRAECEPAPWHEQGRVRQGRSRLARRSQLSVTNPLATGDALVLEGVTRTFGALKAIEDVSLSVAAGERRALIGANGAGKTTLFNAITGDFPPTSGRVRFFGEDVTAMPPHERIRMGLRRTYQSSLLFRDLTVRDNLFLAVRGVTRRRFGFLRPRGGHSSRLATEDLLHRVRLEAVADQLVSALSHGQQRQLEIGMALAGAPRFILLDE